MNALALCFALFVVLMFVVTSSGRRTRTFHLPMGWKCSLRFPTVKVYSEDVGWSTGRRWMSSWFRIGSVIGICAVPLGVIVLAANLASHVSKMLDASSAKPDRETMVPTLEVMLPGYNLPVSDFGYYFVSLLLSSVFHEAGHALAASVEGVPTLDCGMMLFVVVPVAFVNFPTKDLEGSSTWAKIRIFTGGIWHNIVLSLASYSLLKSVPWMFFLLYRHQAGVLVTSVAPDTGLVGPSGLTAGDVLLSVNGCPVGGFLDFKGCISKVLNEDQGRWCVASVNKLYTDSREKCCAVGSENSTNLCFESTPVVNSKVAAYYCLDVRKELDGNRRLCKGDDGSPDGCNVGRNCMLPLLRPGEKLIQIHRENSVDFLFIGNPVEVYNYVEVSDYIPRFFGHLLWLSWVPGMFEKQFYYIVILSSALGVLNAVPCWLLDGQFIVETVVNSFTSLDFKIRKALARCLLHFGTFLLVTSLALGLKGILF